MIRFFGDKDIQITSRTGLRLSRARGHHAWREFYLSDQRRTGADRDELSETSSDRTEIREIEMSAKGVTHALESIM